MAVYTPTHIIGDTIEPEHGSFTCLATQAHCGRIQNKNLLGRTTCWHVYDWPTALGCRYAVEWRFYECNVDLTTVDWRNNWEDDWGQFKCWSTPTLEAPSWLFCSDDSTDLLLHLDRLSQSLVTFIHSYQVILPPILWIYIWLMIHFHCDILDHCWPNSLNLCWIQDTLRLCLVPQELDTTVVIVGGGAEVVVMLYGAGSCCRGCGYAAMGGAMLPCCRGWGYATMGGAMLPCCRGWGYAAMGGAMLQGVGVKLVVYKCSDWSIQTKSIGLLKCMLMLQWLQVILNIAVLHKCTCCTTYVFNPY